MALPASGQLGDAASTTVEFQTRIEALRDEVALLMSEMDSAESTLTSLQNQITSNDGDISSINSTLLTKQDKLSELSKTSIFSGSDALITDSDLTGSWAVGKYAFKISDFPTRIFYFEIPDISGTDSIGGVAHTRTNAGSLDTYTWTFAPSPPSFQCNIYSRTSSGVSGTLALITNVYLIE